MKIVSEYVGREIAMCMCITHEGAERLADLSHAGKRFPNSVSVEMMLSIENAFIRVEDGGITSWVVAMQEYRREKHLQEIEPVDIQATLSWLVMNDFIGVTMVRL